MKYSARGFVVLFSAIALAACSTPAPAESGKANVESLASPTASAEATPTPSPTPTPTGPDGGVTRPFGFGVIAQAGKSSRWNVTITEVTANGTSQVLADNQFNEIKDGWQYVVGRMKAELNANLKATDVGKPLSASYVMPVFIGNDGKIYDIWNDDNSAAVLKDDWIGQDDVMAQVGVNLSGRFAIQVPGKAVPGGHLATRNEVSQEFTYFGAPLQ